MEKMVKKTAVAAMLVLLSAGMGSNMANAAKKVSISKTKLTLTVGQSKTLSVKNLSKKNKKKLKWSSNKKKVATVSKKGKVTAKKAGTAKITAKIGKTKYTCKVTVKKNNDSTAKPKTKEQLAAEDRKNLTTLIKQQRAAGATISEDLEARDYYSWNEDGRLTRLDLSDDEGSDLKISGVIDVTMFTALETLYLDYNQNVTGVKTAGVTTLKNLGLEGTKVSSLNVTTNVNLEKLYISSTQISSLDVTKNVLLESLSCSRLGLTSLNVSKNPALTYLYCTGNKFTTLDLSALGKSKEVSVTCDKGVKVTGVNSNVTVKYYPEN